MDINDRMRLAAIADRFAYEGETVSAEDAAWLWQVVPRSRSGVSVAIGRNKSSGTTQGFAAGVGNVTVKDDKRNHEITEYGGKDRIRAGQWKISRLPYPGDGGFSIRLGFGRAARRPDEVIIFEQMMGTIADSKEMRMRYRHDGQPVCLQFKSDKRITLPFPFRFEVVMSVPRWIDWKPVA